MMLRKRRSINHRVDLAMKERTNSFRGENELELTGNLDGGQRRVNRLAPAITASLVVVSCVYLALLVSNRQSALFGIRVLIGITLYHGSFSFPSAWRQFI